MAKSFTPHNLQPLREFAARQLPGLNSKPLDIDTEFIKDKNVLIVVENLPVPFDRRVWLEARTLQSLGANVSVICPTTRQYPKRRETLEGINVYRHPLPADADSALGYLFEYSTALFWQNLIAWRLFLTQGIDVLHGCNPPDLIFLVAIPLRLFGVRYLFDHHDINPELYEAKFKRRGFFWQLMNCFERWTFRVATVSIATNESYRQIAINRGNMCPEDVFVVRSGPDLSRIRPVPANPKWLDGRTKLIGYVGVMGEQEGIDLLLNAVKIMKERYGRDDFRVVLIGGGSSLEELRHMAVELGVNDCVHFTGRASDEELLEILSTADVCVNPDRVNEMNDKSTMNKIMEYMALGKPIVQFDVTEGRASAGPASLYARPNDTADLADKIIELLDAPEQSRQMGELGQSRVREFLSWDSSIPPLVAAYRRILQVDREQDAEL